MLDIYGLVPDSIVDGPGLRYAVFVQGCTGRCPGCHNPESQPFKRENMMDIDVLADKIASETHEKHLTLSGGDPFDQAEACAELARKMRERGFDIWCWTGHIYESLADDPHYKQLLDQVDVLVDGPYVESKRNLSLKWRGSSNQRVIDVKKSTPEHVVLVKDDDDMPFTRPESW